MSRPNIIFYFSDQQRADTCGCYGQELPITPCVDSLAEEGVLFTHAYTAQPVCGPCRALFQTGKYPTETGCFRNNVALPLDTKTIAHYFTEAGYETAYVGKWHLASDGALEAPPTIDYHHSAIPLERRGGYTGFWRVSDVLEFTSHGYDGYVFDEHMQKREFKGYRADCMVDYALEFLDGRTSDTPFFLTVSQIEPHHQNDCNHYQGPEGSKERYKNYTLPGDLVALEGDYREEYPDYLGACERVDYNLGRIVTALKEKGLYENTIIVFTSDHGSHFRTRNKDQHLLGYDDYKRTCHDAALHVPLVIRGGAYRGGGKISSLVSTASLAKTLLAMADIEVGNDMVGENLLDVVQGKNNNRKNEIFAQISESRVGRALRTSRYTYAVCAPQVNGGSSKDSPVYIDDFLYDMEKDPFQLQNLIHDPDYATTKDFLRKRLVHWINEAEGYTPEIFESEALLQ